jgi:hypothetical protein
MAYCKICEKDYNGVLEDHLGFHTTDPANTAIYLAYLERRIETLERGQKRRSI